MDAFTDIGWFLYISLDSYKIWMHSQTLVGFCTYLLILIKYGCIYRHWLVFVHISGFLSSMDAFTDIGWFLYISLDSYQVWMHLQTLVGFCTYLLILIKYGCIYRHWFVSVHISWFLSSMDAFTDIGWFLYISLDSYQVWMHLQTLVGFCTYLWILIQYGCIHRHWLVSVHISWFLSSMDAFTDIGSFLYISLDPYKVWMHSQTLVGFCTYLWILIKYGCIYRHWLVSVHISWSL